MSSVLLTNPFPKTRNTEPVSAEQKALRALLKKWNRTAKSDFLFHAAKVDAHTVIVSDRYAIRYYYGKNVAFDSIPVGKVAQISKRGREAVVRHDIEQSWFDKSVNVVRKPGIGRSVERIEAAQKDKHVFLRLTPLEGESVVVNREKLLRILEEGFWLEVRGELESVLVYDETNTYIGMCMPTRVDEDNLEWVEVHHA